MYRCPTSHLDVLMPDPLRIAIALFDDKCFVILMPDPPYCDMFAPDPSYSEVVSRVLIS